MFSRKLSVVELSSKNFGDRFMKLIAVLQGFSVLSEAKSTLYSECWATHWKNIQ